MFTKRPLFFAAVFFLAGILVSEYFEPSYEACFIAALLFFSVYFLFRRFIYSAFLILFALFFAAAGMFSLKLNQMDKEYCSESCLVISGRIREKDLRSDGSAVYKLSDVNSGSYRFMYGVFVTSGETAFEPDDIVRFTGIIRRPAAKSWTFGFDDRLYCAANGVSLRMKAIEADSVGRSDDALAKINVIRRHIAGKMDEIFAGSSPVAKAMLIGADESIDGGTLDDYRQSGISHVLCISGLHVGVICFTIYQLLRRLKAPAFMVYILSLASVAAYAALAGFRLSITRASVMFAVMILSIWIWGQYDRLSSLCVAFLAMAAVNPAVVFDMGFQLSFGSVFCMICLSATLPRKVKSSVFNPLLTSSAAFAGSSLLLLNYNNEVNLTALLAGPVAVLLAAAIVPLTAVVTFACLIFGKPVYFLGYAASYFIALLNDLAAIAAQCKISANIPSVAGAAVLAGFAAIFAASKFTVIDKSVKIPMCLLLAAILPFSLAMTRSGAGKLRAVITDETEQSAIVTDDRGACFMINPGGISAEGYLADYGLRPQAVFITSQKELDLLTPEDCSTKLICVPFNADTSGLGGVKTIHRMLNGEKAEFGRVSVLAAMDEEGLEASYTICFEGRRVLCYASDFVPAGEPEKTSVLVCGRLSSLARDYASSCRAEYVIIKNRSSRAGGLRIIDARNSGFITVDFKEGTEVRSVYDCTAVS